MYNAGTKCCCQDLMGQVNLKLKTALGSFTSADPNSNEGNAYNVGIERDNLIQA